MQKLLGASLLLTILVILHTNAFAAPLNCKFKNLNERVEGVETLSIDEDALIVNNTLAIPLEHTRIKCGRFGKQHRFDGMGKGLQIILKSCTDDAALEGHLIDAINTKAAEVICDEQV